MVDAGSAIDSVQVAGQPVWLVLLGSLLTLVIIPLFNMIKPYILTAEQREARAERLRAKANQAETEAMALLREERDRAIQRYEAEFKAHMELVGDHKFVAHKLAEMEMRHQECEEQNREMQERMTRLEAMITPPAAN
jgi:phosphoenolpyruvate-protein kinase (PTS system EI component)